MSNEHTMLSEEQTSPTGTSESRLHELLTQYDLKKAEKNELERQLDQIDEELDPLEGEIINIMVALEFQRISHNGTLYYLAVPGRPSIVPEKRGEFIELLRKWNEDGIIQTDYINSNTLYGWYNNLPQEKKEYLSTSGSLKISEDIQLRSPKDYKRKRAKR